MWQSVFSCNRLLQLRERVASIDAYQLARPDVLQERLRGTPMKPLRRRTERPAGSKGSAGAGEGAKCGVLAGMAGEGRTECGCTAETAHEPVTLGVRGRRRAPPLDAGCSRSSDTAAAHAGAREAEQDIFRPTDDDPFAQMNPAQARAARIRRDREVAAKAAARDKMTQRAAQKSDDAEQQRTAQQSTRPQNEPKTDRKIATSAVRLDHGQHFPHGFQAVEYAYSAEGTWKRLSGLRYDSNVFEEHSDESRPYDPETLALKCASQQHTCCDLEGNILCDPDRVGSVQQSAGSSACAFHQHNGLASGPGGVAKRVSRPRLLFSFDDNVLGNCISQVYGKPAPHGVEASSVNDMNRTFCRCVCSAMLAVEDGPARLSCLLPVLTPLLQAHRSPSQVAGGRQWCTEKRCIRAAYAELAIPSRGPLEEQLTNAANRAQGSVSCREWQLE